MKKRIACVYVLVYALGIAKAQTIHTYAGTGTSGFSGDGGPAVNAKIYYPLQLAVDLTNNLYICDQHNYRIRKVTPSGVISTFAGNGGMVYNGDNIPAVNAALAGPSGIAVDPAGNVYIADEMNSRVRKVSPGGIITTVAGNGTSGFSGDGGLATNAQLAQPNKLCLDPSGNLYINDYANKRIRKVTPAGIITTFVGTGTAGYNGDNIPASTAQINFPEEMTFDGEGNAYIADSQNHRIRKISATDTITTFAGTGTGGFSGDNGPAINAEFRYPTNLVFNGAKELIVADNQNQRLRKINSSGIVTTIVGTGNSGYTGDGGSPLNADIDNPRGLAIDGNGNIYFSNYWFSVVRVICFNNCITTGMPTVTQSSSATIFPNPSKGGFKLKLDGNSETLDFFIYNVLGQKVHEQKIYGELSEIDATRLTKGIYQYKLVHNNSTISTDKIVIE